MSSKKEDGSLGQERKNRDDLSAAEYAWIRRVVEGIGFVDAIVGRLSTRAREARALEMLSDRRVRRCLIERLWLAGKADLIREVLSLEAALGADASLGGAHPSPKLSAELLPAERSKARTGPKVRPQEDSVPRARSVMDLAGFNPRTDGP